MNAIQALSQLSYGPKRDAVSGHAASGFHNQFSAIEPSWPERALGLFFVLDVPDDVGDVLVARAVERSRHGRDGVYDVTVTAGDTVVATFVGRSREIGGRLVVEEG